MPLIEPALQNPLPIPTAGPSYNNNNNNINPTIILPLSLFLPDSTFGDPLPRPKADGHVRLGFCNIDGFPVASLNNPKVIELWSFISQMDLDIFAGCKAKLNWSKMAPAVLLWEWF